MKKIILVVLVSITSVVCAQKPIRGEGEIKTKKYAVDQFTKLEVNFGGTVKIECGMMPLVQVSANENILPLVDVKEKNGALYIGSDSWIENASREILIQVPFLREYTHSGWGSVSLTNLDMDRFTLNASSGSIRLSGKVNSLEINNAGSGSIKLEGLENRYLKVNQTGSSTLSVYSSDTVFVVQNDGVIIYAGSPVILTADGVDGDYIASADTYSDKKASPAYINAKIKNNTVLKKNFFIKGPSNANFSYGFPMGPGASRAERVPVGTKIYQVNAFGVRTKLLVEFTAEDDGRTVELFK